MLNMRETDRCKWCMEYATLNPMRIFISLLLAIGMVSALISPPLAAQEDDNEPVPYSEEEFDDWLHGVRRFEIVAVGTFPITYLLSVLVYDVGRFIAESVRVGSVNQQYAPLFFAPPNKPSFTNDEQIALLLTAAALAVVVAIIDTILIETARDDSD